MKCKNVTGITDAAMKTCPLQAVSYLTMTHYFNLDLTKKKGDPSLTRTFCLVFHLSGSGMTSSGLGSPEFAYNRFMGPASGEVIGTRTVFEVKAW